MSTNGMAFFQANFMLQSPHDQEDHHLPPNHQILTPRATSHDYHGKRSMSFSSSAGGIDIWDEPNAYNGEEDMSDNEGSQIGEKKRRLNMEQVKALEKSFELGNKLEPERKMQLAKALNLQPRQIAIWFQNRRARWKTKQLERDYDLLKRQFDAIKAENDALQTQNQKLHSQILALKNKESTESINLNKETDQGSCSNRSENSSDIKLDISSMRPTNGGVLQFLHNSTRPDVHPHKPDHQVIKEEGFPSMFTGIDDQNGLWPWLEQQHFN